MTSSTAHTAGPWHLSSTHSGAAFDIGAANGANIALVSGPDENGADEFKANARLIAAAPKLLAALEALERQALQSNVNAAANEWGQEALARTRSAIAAAKARCHMSARPDFRYAPSIQQLVTVNSLVRFGRKIVANGNPEGCGHFNFDLLREAPNGDWICEGCWDDAGAEPRWCDLPRIASLPPAPSQERAWKQPPETVADLVNNLLTVDQTMDVHTAYFITYDDGRKEARTRSPSLSRERVSSSRIKTGDETVPYSLVIWASQDDRPSATADAARPSRESLRRLVDIAWNEATESTAVPSTKWADRLIDRALSPQAEAGSEQAGDVDSLTGTADDQGLFAQMEDDPSDTNPRAEGGSVRSGIYIASKTKHADRWRFIRDKAGTPVISTWIDEAGEGESSDLDDLWRRCISEASNCRVLIAYREKDEVLKGGWIEIGAALANHVPVYAVGLDEFTIAKYRGITHFRTMKDAVAAALYLLRTNQGGQPAERREIITRVLGRWKRSKNLHESLAAHDIEKELLSALDGGR